MSPVYKVYEEGNKFLSAEVLEDGSHKIVHGEIEVPVKVEGRYLTFYVSEAVGRKRLVLQSAHTHVGDLRKLKQAGVKEFTVKIPPERPESEFQSRVLFITDHYGEDRVLSLEWHKKDWLPTVSKERK